MATGIDIFVNGNSDGDVITTSIGNDTIFGNGGDDTITSGQGNDSVDGGAGNDVIDDNRGNDYLAGGDGNDRITNWGDSDALDTIDGGAGNDVIVSQGSGSNITGGTGNDYIEALDSGSDTIFYSFNTSTTTVTTTTTVTDTFAHWLAASQLSTASLTQSQFSNQYTGWLQHLVEAYGLGIDANHDGHIAVGMNQNDPSGLPSIEGMSAAQVDALFNDPMSLTVTTGKTTQTRYYSSDFTTSETSKVDVTAISSGDGHDLVVGFNSGGDVLALVGLTQAQALEGLAFKFGSFDAPDGTHDSVLGIRLGLKATAENGLTDTDHDGIADGVNDWSVILQGLTAFSLYEDAGYVEYLVPAAGR